MCPHGCFAFPCNLVAVLPVVLRSFAQVSHPKWCLLLWGSVSDFCAWVPLLLFISFAPQVLIHMHSVLVLLPWPTHVLGFVRICPPHLVLLKRLSLGFVGCFCYASFSVFTKDFLKFKTINPLWSFSDQKSSAHVFIAIEKLWYSSIALPKRN